MKPSNYNFVFPFKAFRILSLLFVLYILLVLGACSNGEEIVTNTSEPNISWLDPYEFDFTRPVILSQLEFTPYIPSDEALSGFAADASFLVQTVEQVHPIFIIEGMLPEEYEDMRDTFLAYSKNYDITKENFVFAAKRYLTTLRDGHASAGAGLFAYRDDEGWLQRMELSYLLDIEFEARNNSLFLRDEEGNPTYIEVYYIGGIPINRVFDIISRYNFSENEVDLNRNRAIFSRYGALLERAGAENIDDNFIITINDENEIFDIKIPLNASLRYLLRNSAVAAGFIARYELFDDVLLIDLRMMELGDEVNKVISATRNAMNDGIRKFIVDVRSNRGGTSVVRHNLFAPLRLTPLAGNSYIVRLSYPLTERYGEYHRPFPTHNTAHSVHTQAFENIRNAEDIFISVLTDNETYSAGTQFAMQVQDRGIVGNVIGAPSRQSPHFFAGSLFFTMPYSEIIFAVSSAYFRRFDANADQLVVWPDIITDPRDALYVALEYLAGR